MFIIAFSWQGSLFFCFHYTYTHLFWIFEYLFYIFSSFVNICNRFITFISICLLIHFFMHAFIHSFKKFYFIYHQTVHMSIFPCSIKKNCIKIVQQTELIHVYNMYIVVSIQIFSLISDLLKIISTWPYIYSFLYILFQQ